MSTIGTKNNFEANNFNINNLKTQVMKTIHLIIATLIIVPLQLTSCEATEESNEIAQFNFTVSDEPLNVSSFSTNPDSVISDEVTGLIKMREEEKMAGDVYSFFYSKFNYRIFGNITKSESRHSDAVLSLLNYFKVTDPSTKTAGTFTDLTLQELYNKFTTEALTIDDALKTGAFIEEYDIADLQKLITETNNADILRVYKNLLRGSGYHLKAFTKLLSVRGIVYEPTILNADEYNSIIKN